ncbi:MAG: GFA family protein [Pseudomonadota bacterium]|nr:GFA family protein [Pseudomonadota bacterium]
MLRKPVKGRCQCGACAYTLDSKPYIAYTCHCSECKKLTASAFLSCMQVASESLKNTRGSPINRERIADSGHVVRTWFCSACGSTLFAENSARPRIRTVHIGSLEHPEDVEVTAHIWVKNKLPWINLPRNHRIFDEAGDWTEDYAQDLSRYQPPEIRSP